MTGCTCEFSIFGSFGSLCSCECVAGEGRGRGHAALRKMDLGEKQVMILPKCHLICVSRQ